MRLIDADVLKTERGMADRCEDCKHDARMCRFNQDYTRVDICDMLDDAPTIPAIPVEWLEYQADNAQNLVVQAVIDYLLTLWRTGGEDGRCKISKC